MTTVYMILAGTFMLALATVLIVLAIRRHRRRRFQAAADEFAAMYRNSLDTGWAFLSRNKPDQERQ